MQLTHPLHEDSPQWDWFKRAVVTTIKRNGKVDYNTKIGLVSTIIWCLGAFPIVRKTINLTYQGKTAPWNAKYATVEKKTKQKYPNTLKGRIALNKVLFAFFRASQVEKNNETGTEAIAMFGMEKVSRRTRLATTGLVLALGAGMILTIANRNTEVNGMIGGYNISGPVTEVKTQAQLQHAVKTTKIASAKLELNDVSKGIQGNTGNKIEQVFKDIVDGKELTATKKRALEKAERERIKDERMASNRERNRQKEDEYFSKTDPSKGDHYLNDVNKDHHDTKSARAEMLNMRLKDKKDLAYGPKKAMYDKGYRDTQNMDFSNRGYEMLRLFEGYSSTAYKDVAGVPTIGTGHTGSLSAIGRDKNVEMGDEITDQEGKILAYHGPGGIKKASKAVRDLVKVKLTQAQFDALTSFVYNNGRGAFVNSSVLTLVNQMTPEKLNNDAKKTEHMDKIQTALEKYCTAKGKVYKGLKKRRTLEAKLFRNGTYPTKKDL